MSGATLLNQAVGIRKGFAYSPDQCYLTTKELSNCKVSRGNEKSRKVGMEGKKEQSTLRILKRTT